MTIFKNVNIPLCIVITPCVSGARGSGHKATASGCESRACSVGPLLQAFRKASQEGTMGTELIFSSWLLGVCPTLHSQVGLRGQGPRNKCCPQMHKVRSITLGKIVNILKHIVTWM